MILLLKLFVFKPYFSNIRFLERLKVFNVTALFGNRFFPNKLAKFLRLSSETSSVTLLLRFGNQIEKEQDQGFYIFLF